MGKLIPLLNAAWAAEVMASASSRMINLIPELNPQSINIQFYEVIKIYLKICLVLANSLILSLTTFIPRSSDALSLKRK